MAIVQVTPALCRAKAEECRLLAESVEKPSHAIMLKHMAETWDRIAKETAGIQ
jgi:hypothetical protein